MPQTIDESILQGFQELVKARREAEGSLLLEYEHPEEAQKFGRRVAREAFEKHVLQLTDQSSAENTRSEP